MYTVTFGVIALLVLSVHVAGAPTSWKKSNNVGKVGKKVRVSKIPGNGISVKSEYYCGHIGEECGDGRVCAGETDDDDDDDDDDDIRCVTPIKEGGQCGQDPYWICETGLECNNGICEHPAPQDCSVLGCPSGEVCVGPAEDLRCVTPQPEGGKCGQDPYWICETELECNNGVCEHPAPQDCSVLGCPTGEVCVGPAEDLRCVTPQPEGGKCGQDPYWICETELECNNGVCEHPAPQDCSVLGCPTGEVCAGPVGSLQCVTPMGEGGQCDVEPYWVCAAPLICQYDVCAHPIH